MKSEYKIVLDLILKWLSCIDINESARAVFRAINELFNGNMEYMDEITISSLVTLSVQFYQRLDLLVYPASIKNTIRSPLDDFFEFFTDGVAIWSFPNGHYQDMFYDWHCAALSANNTDIFNLAISYNNIEKIESVNESFDTKIAPNIEMLECDKRLNISSLSGVGSNNLKQLKKHNILSKPTFSINEHALSKFLSRYDSVPGVKFNQVKFYDKDTDSIYSRIIMENFNEPYLLIFDKYDNNTICGVLLENTNDNNNYIKIQFEDSSIYEYEYDKDIYECNILDIKNNNNDIL